MRVFVFEYVTGGGCVDEPIIASLAAEGDMMLAAVVSDLIQIESVEVIITRDHRFDLPDLPIRVRWVDKDWRELWRYCLAEADAVLPIAPESDGVLEALCRDVENAGKLLLNSDASSVAVAASKYQTLSVLNDAGVATVATHRANAPQLETAGALVVKPDNGVGCQGIHLLLGTQALGNFMATCDEPENWLVQPYVEGVAASLSLLVGPDCVCLLGRNLQRVVQVDDTFLLLGCVVNGLDYDSEPLVELAKQVCASIPGLFGYIGIDLVITEHGPVVLEVNPRLTTSYVGLSRSTGENIAALILNLAANSSAITPEALAGSSVHIDLELGRVA